MNIPATHTAEADTPSGRRRRAVGRLALLGIGAVALFFLLTEHRAHFFGVLPYLLLAACPLMHVFHHRGHGHHADASPSLAAATDEPASHGDLGGHK